MLVSFKSLSNIVFGYKEFYLKKKDAIGIHWKILITDLQK